MGREQVVLVVILVLEISWCYGGVVDEDGWELGRGCASGLGYFGALEKAILFFEGQRSGRLPSRQRVQWRGDSGLADGLLDDVDLAGGYYDAGDNVKFGWPMSFTTTLLSWAAAHYPNEISSARQMHHLRSAIRWAADFILKAHVSPTTLYTQVGDGNADHQCWERPEDMGTPRTLYKITSSSPGTEAAADASAALASSSIVFRSVDRSYSSTLLNSAKSLFEFANEYRGSYQGSCPFYCSYSGYQDELLWAATWLYGATGGSQYLEFLRSNEGWSAPVSEFSWDYKFAGVQVLLAKEFLAGNHELEKYKNDADSFVCSVMPNSSIRTVKLTPGGLLFTRDSANLQYVTTAAFALRFYAEALQSSRINGIRCGSDHVSSTQIAEFGKSQVDYILGKNPLGMSYMVGFGGRYPLHVHHRGSSLPSIRSHPKKITCKDGFSRWFSTSAPNPNVHVGAIVGGPNGNDQFDDVRSDPNHLEPTTYMNAAFVGALASMLPRHSCVELSMKTNATATSAT